MKKNVYLIQPTYMNSCSVHFPYAVASLASYAWKFADIYDNYELKKIYFLRNNISEVVNSIEQPFLIGFSNYIWNFEYNKILANKIKQLYPECTIVFGGPQISPDSNLLEKHSFIDVLIYYEGEIVFRDLLRALLYKQSFATISNISYRNKTGQIINTSQVCHQDFDFPSPYESGIFDRLCQENPCIDFIPLIETSRGCPNNCVYCSWGKINTKVRLFPLERVYHDIEWAAKNKKDFLGFTDANFGMFPRDEQIVDKILQCHHDYGYPTKFQVSYSKDTDERVFNIIKKLNKSGMDKGVTLSFQSMSKTVQGNIGRHNLDIEHYKNLLKKYACENIPTYTDLILGLPGESYQSFKEGIDELLEIGQHSSLFVHLCELLPLSEMSQQKYIDKYKLGFTKIPLNQPHRSQSNGYDVPEFSRIVTSSYSLSQNDWRKTLMFATCVLALHYLGLLQLVSLFLHFEKNIRYSDFYSDVIHHMTTQASSNTIFKIIENKILKVTESHESVTVFDEQFGNIAWPFEEYLFLKIVTKKDDFYAEIKNVLIRYDLEETLLDDLISYQNFVIKTINRKTAKMSFLYDWKSYFDTILTHGTNIPLTKRHIRYTIVDKNVVYSWEEYAKEVLWFGRRGGKNIYTTEIQEEVCDCNE